MSYVNYSVETLKNFCEDIFEKFGFTREEAEQITDVLLLADLYGVQSHGTQRLVRYHKSIMKGCVKTDAKPQTTPACGKSVTPKYFLTVSGLLTIFALVYAPKYLPKQRNTI